MTPQPKFRYRVQYYRVQYVIYRFCSNNRFRASLVKIVIKGVINTLCFVYVYIYFLIVISWQYTRMEEF